jgi:AAHS family 4-hydroxybenzoate transporter-like MFS transporter
MKHKRVDVGEIIDSASFIGKPLGIAVMMIIIMLTDGFDLFIPSYVAPALVNDWAVSRGDVQPFVQSGLIGMAIGSILLGWIGDRVGRKKAYISCLALMFVGSSFCYFSNSISELFLWRLVMGLGLGGVTPLAATLVSEWTNKKMRSIVVAAVIVSIPLGGTLAGFAYRALEPEYGWRSMFAVGAIAPLVLFVLFSYLLPESPKYMAKHPGLHKQLARSLNKLVKEDRFDGSEEFFVAESGKQSSNWFATIFNSDFRVRTVLIWIAFVVNSFVLYIFTSQIPLLLDTANMSAEVSSIGLQYFSFGAILGAIGGAILVGWFGSKYTGTVLAALGGVASAFIALVLMAENVSTLQLFALCAAAGASVNGMQAFLYAIGAHSYPTEVRGSAVGMAQTVSRIGAVVSPMVAGYYFNMEPMPSVSAFFLFMASVIVITVVSFFLIPSHIPRTDRPARHLPHPVDRAG